SSTTEGSRLAKMISVLEEREARRKAVTFSRKSRWALCETQKYRVDCREDQLSCESGYSCLSPSDDGRCCISPTADVLLPSNPTSCPSTTEMGYTCTYGSKRKGTNWCRTNEDCVAGAVHLCCDTGCGFNVCLPSTGHVLDNGEW
ncbi:WAP domain-containing protein, partial [Trichostrongylus colubriformis]